MVDPTGPDRSGLDELVRWLGEAGTATVRSGVAGTVLDDLRNVPPAASVAGTTLQVSTYLWRDFQPMCPPGGHGLIVIARTSSEPVGLPPGIRAERIAVVHDNAVWTAPAVEEHSGMRSDTGFEVIARDGPKWGPGIRVDVVVQYRDGDGRAHLVRSSAQPIDRTD